MICNGEKTRKTMKKTEDNYQNGWKNNQNGKGSVCIILLCTVMKNKKKIFVACLLALVIVTPVYLNLWPEILHMITFIWNFCWGNSVTNIGEKPTKPTLSPTFNVSALLQGGKGILFVETTDRMQPPSLVLCSIESAARVYPDRPVVFFMKGLGDIRTEEDEKKAKELFTPLSGFQNIYVLPLRMAELFYGTPLMNWYNNVIPEKEVYWTHVSSDACRFAMMWKYGGIYMDTDVISLRPIPSDKFVAGEDMKTTSSSVFGLPPHENLTKQFMQNFVDEYRGEIWAHQGPGVLTRVVKKVCGLPKFTSTEDAMCNNVSYFHPHRFYPILYPQWRSYFQVWKEKQKFNDSYALHLWNFMNKEGEKMRPGSHTLVEHLYQHHCNTTYEYCRKNKKPENHL